MKSAFGIPRGLDSSVTVLGGGATVVMAADPVGIEARDRDAACEF